jgi:hypothetical protein
LTALPTVDDVSALSDHPNNTALDVRTGQQPNNDPSMIGDKVSSLGGFLNYVRDVRQNLWRLADDKELWFRGESQDHENTSLRPELYRPRQPNALRPVDDLLDIESALYEEFQRCADQFRSETLDRKYWEWDSYFLLQHHGGATRLLD